MQKPGVPMAPLRLRRHRYRVTPSLAPLTPDTAPSLALLFRGGCHHLSACAVAAFRGKHPRGDVRCGQVQAFGRDLERYPSGWPFILASSAERDTA